jgi:hypothetical protein
VVEQRPEASSRSEEYLTGIANRALKALEAHHAAARFWGEVGRWWLGLAALALSLGGAFLAGTVALQESPSSALRAAAAIVVAAAAAIEIVRLQLGPQDLSEKHRRAANSFAATRRRAEVIAVTMAEGELGSREAAEQMAALVEQYDEAGRDAPIVPRRIWRTVQGQLRGRRLSAGTPYFPDMGEGQHEK